MFQFLLSPKFLAYWVGINFFLSLFFYLKVRKYFYSYKLIEVEGKLVDLHERYPEFRRYDVQYFSFLRIFFGFLFLFWIKYSLCLISAACYCIYLKIALINYDPNKPITQSTRNKVRFGAELFIGLANFAMGMIIDKQVIRRDDIYKKYLGEDYVYDKDEKYSLIISNHNSWVEIVYYLQKLTPGFIAKKSVRDIPLIGFIAQAIDSLFIDRIDPNSRSVIAKQLSDRQQAFMQGKILTPLMIFPEGTITTGKHLLPFKRGAFEGLLPIKPLMVKLNDGTFSISTGALDLFQHVILTLCFLYHRYTIYELPIIVPTEAMFKNYKGDKKEKWEIYSETVRDIYCEIGGYVKSESVLQDSFDYCCLIKGRKIKNF